MSYSLPTLRSKPKDQPRLGSAKTPKRGMSGIWYPTPDPPQRHIVQIVGSQEEQLRKELFQSEQREAKIWHENNELKESNEILMRRNKALEHTLSVLQQRNVFLSKRNLYNDNIH